VQLGDPGRNGDEIAPLAEDAATCGSSMPLDNLSPAAKLPEKSEVHLRPTASGVTTSVGSSLVPGSRNSTSSARPMQSSRRSTSSTTSPRLFAFGWTSNVRGGNANVPDDYVWLEQVLTTLASNRAASLGCIDTVTGQDAEPLFFVLKGSVHFGLERVKAGGEGGREAVRAYLEQEGQISKVFLHLVWQEDWTSNLFARSKYIKGKIVYQKDPQALQFFPRRYSIVDGIMTIALTEDLPFESVLPGNDIKVL